LSYHGKFDPADFIVPPALGKGESQKVQCFVQNEHKRALNVIARSGVFPFEMEADVIRWCIQFGLTRLSTLEPTLINSMLRRANMMLDELREETYLAKHREWMEKLTSQIRGYVGRGEADRAHSKVQYHYAQVMAMPQETDEEAYWKGQYLKVLEDNFREFIPYEQTRTTTSTD
jgi:hypothetical protein